MKLTLLVICMSIGVAHLCLLPEPNCPQVYLKKDFNITDYLGLWYEISRVPTPFQNGDCVTANYTLQDVSMYPVNVLNRELNANSNKYETREGGARFADDANGDGHLMVLFPPPVTPPAGVESNYLVLDTDYINYSVVFSCNEFSGNFTRTVWILSRTSTISDAAMNKVNIALIRNLVDRSTLVVTNQSEEKCKEE